MSNNSHFCFDDKKSTILGGLVLRRIPHKETSFIKTLYEPASSICSIPNTFPHYSEISYTFSDSILYDSAEDTMSFSEFYFAYDIVFEDKEGIDVNHIIRSLSPSKRHVNSTRLISFCSTQWEKIPSCSFSWKWEEFIRAKWIYGSLLTFIFEDEISELLDFSIDGCEVIKSHEVCLLFIDRHTLKFLWFEPFFIGKYARSRSEHSE